MNWSPVNIKFSKSYILFGEEYKCSFLNKELLISYSMYGVFN